jgi:hypothetical protein
MSTSLSLTSKEFFDCLPNKICFYIQSSNLFPTFIRASPFQNVESETNLNHRRRFELRPWRVRVCWSFPGKQDPGTIFG